MSSISMFDIKSKIKQIKNTVLQMTPLEIKVRECTSNDPWGVKQTDKLEVADHTFNYEDFKLIMSVIRIRLADVGKDWRHVQKGIQLMEFLVIHGSERCLDEARDMTSLIRHLKNFKYVDDEGKDWGVNVRDAAKHFLEFIKNEEAIKEEREKAKEEKSKYEGFSRTEAKYKARSSGSSSSEKKKKPQTTSYDDDDYEAPKKSTSRSSMDDDEYRRDDDDERRSSPPPKSTSTTSGARPRRPSTGTEPQATVVKQQPQQQKEDTLIDFFDTQPTGPTNTGFGNNAFGNNSGFGNNNNFGFNNQQQQQQQFANTANTSGGGFNPRGGNTSGGFNPRGGNTAPSFGGNQQQTNDFEANFDSSGFDDAFGNSDSFGTGSTQEKKDSTLFDLSSGLVNLDLNDSGKKQPQQQQQNSQPQTTNMTLKELKRLQGTTTPPNKPPTMNTSSFNTPSFPPSNQPWGNTQPPMGGYGHPPMGGNWNNTPPMGGGGYPPRNQPPSGMGYQPPQGNAQWNMNNQPRPNTNTNAGGFDFF
ncbi:hypothetical protein C9374_001061 [Naegleria lovaniensis]|uniref:ENTH domain-containing protein n=1 Tax=Naegleria lovaniensis TaxID=51637 RepID=A0AA88KP17_NAELO|nr:uncharacterized protein C9374_001061 [Naegleria lovaniensis]KAG2388211.1 hypothetical protein C9374_001061 [Naegleria lovaniensis]